jgi:hypothetical protein
MIEINGRLASESDDLHKNHPIFFVENNESLLKVLCTNVPSAVTVPCYTRHRNKEHETKSPKTTRSERKIQKRDTTPRVEKTVTGPALGRGEHRIGGVFL